ncbi:unnamed protein product [Nyctereutes procyonoides]|uniref:(raccoon dog) hypothetical protein n=1 Tax=Nyctereutes procyonoides TaxID=34880 RepID=A0A811ZSV4_NYCPR|nr:unnamed protein product [Nyctereutes procyonoides]
MSESKKGTARGRDGKTTNNMTLPDKQPCLTPSFLLPQTRSVLRIQIISVLPVPQPHTGRPLPGETTVPAATSPTFCLLDSDTPASFHGVCSAFPVDTPHYYRTEPLNHLYTVEESQTKGGFQDSPSPSAPHHHHPAPFILLVVFPSLPPTVPISSWTHSSSLTLTS